MLTGLLSLLGMGVKRSLFDDEGYYGYEDETAYMQDMARMEEEQMELDRMNQEDSFIW